MPTSPFKQYMRTGIVGSAATPRVFRLLDSEPLTAAYGPAAWSAMPVEIVDVGDGTWVAQWSSDAARAESAPSGQDPQARLDEILAHLIEGAPIQVRRSITWTVDDLIRYESEEDMWRDLHARARAASVKRAKPFAVGAGTRSWSMAASADIAQELTTRASREVKYDGALQTEMEAAFAAARSQAQPEENVTNLGSLLESDSVTRDAWCLRPHAVPALPDHLPRARRIAVPGESDARPLDSLGRRNVGAAASAARRRL